MLFKELMTRLGISAYENADQYVIEDAMPHRTVDFLFVPVESAASFWVGWESDFEGVDSKTMLPFGSDGHYFLLITENPSDPADPLLLKVDHEQVGESPVSSKDVTVGAFLATLERTG